MYTIEPIVGREAIQRLNVKLPEKASSYNGRKVTLNERFSVVERGYTLVYHADENCAPNGFAESRPVSLVPHAHAKLKTSEEMLSHLEALAEKNRLKEGNQVTSSQEASPAKTTAPSPRHSP